MLALLGLPLDNGLLTALLALCGVTATLMLLRGRQFRKVTGRDLAREQLARLREQREIRRAMDDLLQQLEQFNQKVNHELDAKLSAVNAAIKTADERLARLARLGLAEAPIAAPIGGPASEPVSTNLEATDITDEVILTEAHLIHEDNEPAPAIPITTASINEIPTATPEPLAPLINTEPRPRRNAILRKATTTTSRRATTQAYEPVSAHHQRVYDLVDSGRSPIGVAEEIGVSLGEVELILNLRHFGASENTG